MPYAADYFVRPINGSDAAAGTSFAAAFKTLQKALDTAVAGKKIGVCAEADEVLTAAVDDDTNVGTASAQIDIISLNASGERDGTRYVLDGNSAVVNCLVLNGNGTRYKNYIGLEFKNATGAGVTTAVAVASTGVNFFGCHSHNNGGIGFDSGVANTYIVYNSCSAYLNGGHGFGCTATSVGPMTKCTSFLNAGSGFYFGVNAQTFICCLSFKNTGNGIEGLSGRCVLYACVIDGNAVGIKGTTTPLVALFCRITNNTSFAIQVSSGGPRENFNYYYNNNGGGAKFDYTTGGISSGIYSVDMAADGYVNRAANDYSLKNGATPAEGRWVELMIGLVNKDYFCAGLNPNPDFSTAANTLIGETTDGKDGTAVDARPSITGLDIVAVPTAGGTTITMTGVGLTGFSAATLGGTACTDITAISDTLASFKTPAKSAETYALAITTTYGTFTFDKAINVNDNITPEQEAGRNTDPGIANVKKDVDYKILNEDLTGTYDVSYPSVSSPVLSGVVDSSTAITLEWTSGIYIAYWKLKRKTASTEYAYIGGDVSNKFYVAGYENTGLTPSTAYTYMVEAYDGNGEVVYSNALTRTTFATASVPTSNAEGDLLVAVRDAILEIVDGDGEDVFASKDVIIGEFCQSINDEDGNAQRDLINKESTDFPCVEISNMQRGGRGEEYESQRQIRGVYGVRIALHEYKSTVARVTGADIQSISLLASAILRQMYRLTDHASGDNPPCSGFLMTLPDYSVEPAYEIISEHINTEIIEVYFRVDNEDTEL